MKDKTIEEILEGLVSHYVGYKEFNYIDQTEIQEALTAINKELIRARIDELENMAKNLPTEPPKNTPIAVFDTGTMYQAYLRARLEELTNGNEGVNV